MRQADSNERDIRKVMSLFDDIMTRLTAFNNKADELHVRLDAMETKWKPDTNEQINSMRDEMNKLETDLATMNKEKPSWLELNAIVKPDKTISDKAIVDRVKKAAGSGILILSHSLCLI